MGAAPFLAPTPTRTWRVWLTPTRKGPPLSAKRAGCYHVRIDDGKLISTAAAAVPGPTGDAAAKRKPTLRDVAALIGVSPKTVSRVINDEDHVTREMSDRVRWAIQSLGFRPNPVARSLRLREAPPSIGLVIEDLTNPFYSTIAHAVEGVARAHGHMVIVSSSEENPVDERQIVNSLLCRNVNGLILVPTGDDHDYLLSELNHGTKVVFLDRPPGNLKIDVVLLDDFGGTRAAIEHLVDRGHRRIGIVGDATSIYTARKRLEGYRRALKDRGLPVLPELERLGSHGVDSATRSTLELLSLPDPVSAVFATNNRNCIGVVRAVHSQRSSVAIVGFDDFEFAEVLVPPVSVVSFDVAAMGRKAAELLFSRLAGADGPPRCVKIPTRFVPRGIDHEGAAQAPLDAPRRSRVLRSRDT